MGSPPLGMQTDLDVSRETFDRLCVYVELVKKWNPAINLVSATTLNDIWTRHVMDSAAAFQIAKTHKGLWVDIGTGGGFPGVVVAILAHEKAPDLKLTCVESDIRKAAFLSTVARTLKIPIGVLSRRIEEVKPQNAAIVSARAVAALPKLLDYAHRHLAPNGRAIFLKGASWQDEVAAARETWNFDMEVHPSATPSGSVILNIGDLSRA